jgi:inorganic phosphate transporter, PiT family
MSKGLAHIEMLNSKVLLAGLLGAISWNLITLTLGSPTGSSHALMGGGITRISDPDHERVEIAGAVYFLSPVIGMIVGITVTITTTWIAKDQRPKKVDRWFRRSQLLSAAGYSLGHSTNDAQRAWVSSPQRWWPAA